MSVPSSILRDLRDDRNRLTGNGLNRGLRKTGGSSSADTANADLLASMAQRLKKLEMENAEMKAYMSKRGLSWPPPGLEEDASADSGEDSADSVSVVEINASHLPRILKNIDELNAMAPSKNELDARKGKFIDNDEVIVAFFSNGISVNRGPFRPYSWPLAQQFLKDLFDGYFPYEFKEKYPEGVFLKVVNKSSERFVQGQEDLDRVVLSQDQFLRRLPRTVIKNGKIVEVKKDPAPKKEPTIDECTVSMPNSGESSTQQNVAMDEKDIATVNVRGSDGTVSQRIRISKNATVALLRSQVKSNQPAFRLRTVVPPRLLSEQDDLLTIEQAGLFPSGLIVMVSK
eukprot:ANDGO_03865.mRNA.1 hypothetical protein NAEGRDRAFT_50561